MRKIKLRPGFKTALKVAAMCLWVFASLVATQLIVGFGMISILGRETFSQPVWTAVYSALSYIIAGALIIFVPKRWAKSSREGLGLKGLPTWTDIGLSPVGFVVSLIFAAGIVALFNVFPWFNADEIQNVGFNVYMSGGDRIIAFLTLVVAAPIAEEIIFRGWLYGKIREKWGVLPSILVVSFLFGLIHFQWNVGVNVFCLSIVLCGLREITGTIYAGILTHMIKNGVAFYLLYVLGI